MITIRNGALPVSRRHEHVVRHFSLIIPGALALACSSGPTTPPVSAVPPVIAAGNASACALTSDSLAVCWGAAVPGHANLPTWKVSTTLKFAAITAATRFACGLTPAGAAYCWGANDVGQLGDGTNSASLTPVAVAGGHVFASI